MPDDGAGPRIGDTALGPELGGMDSVTTFGVGLGGSGWWVGLCRTAI